MKWKNKKIEDIVHKILNNPKEVLTNNEVADFNSAGLKIEISELREISSRFGPSILRLEKPTNQAPKLFLLLVVGGVALNPLTEDIISYEQKSSAEPMNKNEFEIIYLSPAPHPDIRIGNQVFSYGAAFI